MKKLGATLLLTLSLFAASTTRTHAVVGIVVGSPIVMVISGVVAVGGYGVGAIQDHRGVYGGPVPASWLYSLITIPLGLVILDEAQESELAFTSIKAMPGISADEIATYNAELDELNAISQTITAELKETPRDAEQLWREYGDVLSPATIKIAAHIGHNLLNNL